jgi:glutathione synthase/RimK-type ligase-like ATP-grasp enzyme
MFKVGLIAERRYLSQSMPAAALRVLEARGVWADVICPDDARFAPETGLVHLAKDGWTLDLNDYDVIVSRNRNGLGLAMLSYAEAAGVPTINSYGSTERIRNKANMAVWLSRAGLLCPPTILARDASTLAGLPRSSFPLILKPTYGDNSQGLQLVRRPEDLETIEWSDDLLLAQRYLPSDGFDLKLYVCGRSVFAVYKPTPFNGDLAAAPRPVEATPAMVDLALRCGATFGLEIYGVDTIETPDGLAVIEVNEFPNFTGVPNAGECVADYILSRARAARVQKGAARGTAPTAHRVSAAAFAN